MAIETIRVDCAGCTTTKYFKLKAPATYICQTCGCRYGFLTPQGPGIEKVRALEMTCQGCEKSFPAAVNTRMELKCISCGEKVLYINGPFRLSRFSREPIEDVELPEEEEQCVEAFKSSLKVVIPYYGGDKRVQRAVRTWIYPEVVFALTDPEVIPPGSGICSQFFTPKNGTLIGGKRTKPFLIDILKRMFKMFPNEDFYGFFNSDIILPPGVHLKHLLPRKGCWGVFHHRLIVSGHDHLPIFRLQRRNEEILGKDGFIINRKMLKRMIQKFPKVIVGAPGWDDSFLMWCWDEFGKDKIDIRWGEIWHAAHDLQWRYDHIDARYNFKVLRRTKTSMYDWEKFYKEHRPKVQLNHKTLGIIQPGRLGDIAIVAPIAKWYFDRGYHVVWPVVSSFIDMLQYIPYVEPIDIGPLNGSYQAAIEVLEKRKVDKVIDLGIGFGRNESDWIDSALHFNEWKYKEAKVPFERIHTLQIVRDLKKELVLFNLLAEKYNLNGQAYSVVHKTSSVHFYDWPIPGAVEVVPIDEFTIFDWIMVLEKASVLFLTDSCISALVNGLNIGMRRRFVRYFPRPEEKSNPVRRELGKQMLAPDWGVIA